MSDLPDLLTLTPMGDTAFHVFQPAESAEGRDVVFSGQLLGQMMVASHTRSGEGKDVRSVHAVFARPGSYTSPLQVDVDTMQAGRTFASDTVTATQGGKLLARAVVLLTTDDDDLVRHGPAAPHVAGPEGLEDAVGQVFPGTSYRPVPGTHERDGAPAEFAWIRSTVPLPSVVANQAALAWATCGNVIGLSFRPHADLDIRDAHRTISTGVVAQTVHFLEPVDLSAWHLMETVGTKAANGRVYGEGRVFTADGLLVATFEQDSMARRAAQALDPARAM